MRLLFISHSLPLAGEPASNIGGMQRVALELRDALVAHPDVEPSSLVLESASRWNGPATALFLPTLLPRIPAIIRRDRIEAVLFSSMVTASVALPLRRALARRGVVIGAIPIGRDVTLPNPLYQRLVPSVLRSLDVAFPISSATGEESVARGLPRERMRIVPCGIDVSRFPEVRDRRSTRAELLGRLRSAGTPVREDAFLLLALGRHQQRKGFHWFIERVLPMLPPDVVLLLGGSGPMTPRIRSLVERDGLQERVMLLGRVSEEMLATLYRGADLFMMPNVPVPGDIEGFGVVMLEAGLCGLPTIGADLEGIRDVVRDGESGHLLPSGDAQAFAEGISRYRSDRPALRTLALSSRASVIERFSWPIVVDRYLAGFRPLVRRGDPSLRSG